MNPYDILTICLAVFLPLTGIILAGWMIISPRTAVPDIAVCTTCPWKTGVRPASLLDRITGTRRVECRLSASITGTARRRPGTRCKDREDANTIIYT